MRLFQNPTLLCRLQVEDYSKRKGQELEFTQKWLSPMLKCAFRTKQRIYCFHHTVDFTHMFDAM